MATKNDVRVRTVITGFAGDIEGDTIPKMVIAVERGALMLESEIKVTLSGSRSGRWYRVPNTKGRRGKGVPHRASAPGEAPATLFGGLRNSITHTPATARGEGKHTVVRSEVGVRKGSAAEKYAPRLEFGGFHRQGRTVVFPTLTGFARVKAGTLIRTLPRPFMRPSVDRAEPKIEAYWTRVLR